MKLKPMEQRKRGICITEGCNSPSECIDDWQGVHCAYHHDVMAEREQERREWDYYHPRTDD